MVNQRGGRKEGRKERKERKGEERRRELSGGDLISEFDLSWQKRR